MDKLTIRQQYDTSFRRMQRGTVYWAGSKLATPAQKRVVASHLLATQSLEDRHDEMLGDRLMARHALARYREELINYRA